MGGGACLCHVVDDDGGVFCLGMLQEVLEKCGFAGSEKTTQHGHRNSIFRLLAERLVSRRYAR